MIKFGGRYTQCFIILFVVSGWGCMAVLCIMQVTALSQMNVQKCGLINQEFPELTSMQK